MHPSPRRLLLVAPAFPPMGGGGVQRVAKWAKWLPSFGWGPAVVAMRPRPWYPRDRSLLRDVPPDAPVEAVAPVELWKAGARIESMGLRLAGGWLRGLCSWPDADVGWVAPAVLRALALARRHRASVVLSSAPPWSAHLAGWIVSRLTGLPWVADYRDEWASPRVGLRGRCDAWVEDRWLRSAAAVVATTECSRDVFQRLGARRAVLVRNGFDEEDLAGAPWSPAPKGDALELLHAGSLYGASDPSPFLRAVEGLVADGLVPQDRLRVRLVGPDWTETASPRRPWLTSRAYVDHASVVEEYRRAHALLLFLRDSPRRVLGKTYECLATGRPCLLVGDPAGETARLIAEACGGRTVSPEDPAALRQGLLDLFAAWREGRLPGGADPRVVSQWTRRGGAERLAELLDEVVSG